MNTIAVTESLPMDLTQPVAEPQRPGLNSELWSLFLQNRLAICLTYLLLLVENGLRILQPFLLGWAVNDLLQKSTNGLIAFAVGHCLMMSVQFFRQVYDTRLFSRMYAHRVKTMIREQQQAEVPTSRIVARAGLSRQLINFFEQQLPKSFSAVFSSVGGLLMLACYQPLLIVWCLLLAIPVGLLNLWLSRSLKQVSRDMHDRWEQEVECIASGSPSRVAEHYSILAGHWVRMSDLQARTTGLTEILVLGLMAWALMIVCNIPDVLPGDIFAVFRYLMMFIVGIDTVPLLVEQIARLKDICRRL